MLLDLLDDGRVLVLAAVTGAALIGQVRRGSPFKSGPHEPAWDEEQAARYGAALYERRAKKIPGQIDDEAYAEAWRELERAILDRHPDLDPEAVNAMYERFVNEVAS